MLTGWQVCCDKETGQPQTQHTLQEESLSQEGLLREEAPLQEDTLTQEEALLQEDALLQADALQQEEAPLPEEARLQEGVLLEADGEVINIEVGHLVPVVTDWDDDGKKDLLVGQFSGGKIGLYLNTGTDSEPELKFSEYLKAAGEEISLPSG